MNNNNDIYKRNIRSVSKDHVVNKETLPKLMRDNCMYVEHLML